MDLSAVCRVVLLEGYLAVNELAEESEVNEGRFVAESQSQVVWYGLLLVGWIESGRCYSAAAVGCEKARHTHSAQSTAHAVAPLR